MKGPSSRMCLKKPEKSGGVFMRLVAFNRVPTNAYTRVLNGESQAGGFTAPVVSRRLKEGEILSFDLGMRWTFGGRKP